MWGVSLTHNHTLFLFPYPPCSVLQCVAVCCSVLQCVAVCCSVLQCIAVCCIVLQCITVCCIVLYCVTVCCSALQLVCLFACLCKCKAHWQNRTDNFTHSLAYSPLAARCNITATHCNTLQHTTTFCCNTLKHTTTYCYALQHTATHCNTL